MPTPRHARLLRRRRLATRSNNDNLGAVFAVNLFGRVRARAAAAAVYEAGVHGAEEGEESGDVHLDEQGNADDAGDADAIHGMRVSSAAWVLLRAGRWSRQMHLQASDEEEADQAQALRHGRVQFPERRDGDGEDDQELGQEPSDHADPGYDQNDENLAGGEDAAVEAED
ncbi:MAG: hypothetical protein LQ347_001753 [Umbilicaria vellea]|nr:MAG: hypothetical protein LQ347_001753 [Umbilicaria vellea]